MFSFWTEKVQKSNDWDLISGLYSFSIYLMRLETKIDLQDYKGIQEKVDNSVNLSRSNEERIDKLEDNLKWIVRLVFGAVILGILAYIYNM